MNLIALEIYKVIKSTALVFINADRIDKKKAIITAIVTLVLTVAGMIFGITYTDNDIKEISEGIETVVNIVDNKYTKEMCFFHLFSK